MPNVTDLNVALDGKITFQLDDGTTKIVDLANLGSGGGGGSVTTADITDAGAAGRQVLQGATVAAIKTVLALVKADVGLSNVDNTSDANKPISTATQTALNTKVTAISSTNPRTLVLPSTVAWLNSSNNSRTVSVTGGTVSSVGIATLSDPTNYVVQGTTSGNFTVQPGGQIKIVWSSQPTITVS